ncbi:MAG TPA: A/G-specific adenine glycosylase [Anaerolineaceae bacterium]|uniref:Adenine DNA glycosylase n=1 Tax=Anaerolinea thermophila TaxID=167964 RepID=A0A101FYC0_9CHLR|nr:MAG: A/G-specific adenine glycosylase [Anaerolinea thermophila]HAF62907.1 A/G-specific adenine glycosylase [Anaerolineaceae bacterium]
MHEISHALLKWYRKHQRSLPWRGEIDPYLVWVSEIMLQQTRVDTVIPYYLKWKKRFPTLQALAAAPEGDVLLLWEGLGYYSRARNLHLTAQLIHEKYGGVFPQDPNRLRSLPGIGEYTANAIASICFAVPLVAMDANIKRIFARLMDFEEPLTSQFAKTQLANFGRTLLGEINAGDLNQALMDLGSSICLPGDPNCELCPLSPYCVSHQNGTQTQRPVMKKKKEIPTYQVVAAAIINEHGEFLLAKRPKGGMLPGLWEFPGGKVEAREDDPTALLREISEELGTSILIGKKIGGYRHAYTHFRVVVRAYLCTLDGPAPQALEAQEIKWVTREQMQGFAMGKVDRMIARDLCGMGSILL